MQIRHGLPRFRKVRTKCSQNLHSCYIKPVHPRSLHQDKLGDLTRTVRMGHKPHSYSVPLLHFWHIKGHIVLTSHMQFTQEGRGIGPEMSKTVKDIHTFCSLYLHYYYNNRNIILLTKGTDLSCIKIIENDKHRSYFVLFFCWILSIRTLISHRACTCNAWKQNHLLPACLKNIHQLTP